MDTTPIAIYSYNESERTSCTEIATGIVEEYTWDYRNRLTQIITKTNDGTILRNSVKVYMVKRQPGIIVAGYLLPEALWEMWQCCPLGNLPSRDPSGFSRQRNSTIAWGMPRNSLNGPIVPKMCFMEGTRIWHCNRCVCGISSLIVLPVFRVCRVGGSCCTCLWGHEFFLFAS
jgi:hypothetical protein